MKRVLKYPVAGTRTFVIKLPRGAEILHVAEQEVGKVYLWALVSKDEPEDERTFHIVGTGWDIIEDDPGQYVGTFFLRRDGYVFHLFETTGKA